MPFIPTLRPRPALLAVAIGALLSSAHAADLLQIYDRAVVADPVLREAEQNLFATRETRPQARALLLPRLSLEGRLRYQSLDSRGSDLTGVSSRRDVFATQDLQAVVDQTLYNRADWMTLTQTEHGVTQAEAEYRAAQTGLTVRTAEAYLEVLRRADALRVQEALARANARTLEQSRQRFEVGLVAITDVHESQAAYDRARAGGIAARAALDNAWEALRTIVGPISVPLARLGERLPLSPPQPDDMAAWAAAALQHNDELLAAQAGVRSARAAIEVERSGHYPSVGLQAGYTLSRSDAELATSSDSAFVGLSVTVPLFEGGAVASRTREASHRLQAALERLDQRRRAVDQAVKNAFRGVLSSIEDVKARQAAIISARSALASVQAGLEVGTRTQVDVLNAQRDLFQAELEHLDARYSYILDGLKLHQATSSLTRDTLSRANAWLDPSDVIHPPAE